MAKFALAAVARSTKRLTASYFNSSSSGISPFDLGVERGGINHTVSPAIPRGERLVAIIFIFNTFCKRVSTNGATAWTMCSQLSRRRRRALSRKKSTRV
jgi:hypothetical protein